jgi:hypothetical protein
LAILNDRIVVGTSIAPVNIEHQMLAIKSWIKNGFQVVSCNVKEEIEIIKPFFEGIDIEFEEIPCVIDSVRTKPLPYLQDILLAANRRTEGVVGFINSDIYLDRITSEFYDFLMKETKNSLVFIRRNEIDDIEDIREINWTIHFDGIDMFLIDSKFVCEFYDDGFFVQSCWDHCILIKAEMQGIQIKELMNPIAFHKRHKQRWNFETSNILVERFWEKYYKKDEHVFEKVMDKFYDILLTCRQICFLKEEKISCLCVVDPKDNRIVTNLESQELDMIDITIQYDDQNIERYKYVFYIPVNTRVSPVFCKTIIYIMYSFGCSSLEAGKFYVLKVNEKYHNSSLNRNIHYLEEIQEECRNSTIIYRIEKNFKRNNIYLKKVLRPIIYENISIENRNIFRKIKPKGKYYIAPAGIRAAQWYTANNYKMITMQFAGFIDSNKKGKNNYGIIYPMDILLNDSEAYVIIASKYYAKEIIERTMEFINEDRLLNAGNICYISPEGDLFYFDLEQYKRTLKSELLSEDWDTNKSS